MLIAAGGGALALAVAAAFVLLAPTGGQEAGIDDPGGLLTVSSAPGPSSAVALTGIIVVDVEGAVAEPGVHELVSGSRVADAIAAAGGYATDADLDAAADLNLAQPLVDGQQVRVPRIGEGVAAAPSAEAAGGAAAGSLVNVNTATPEELEALPGIGAVTVQKIVAARQERPFSSLQDMVDRGVIHNGQLEDITGLATAG